MSEKMRGERRQQVPDLFDIRRDALEGDAGINQDRDLGLQLFHPRILAPIAIASQI